MPRSSARHRSLLTLALLFALLAPTAWVSLSRAEDDEPAVPPPAAEPVDFDTQVLPILAARCAGCHNSERAESGLSLETREDLLLGGFSGEAAYANDSEDSLMIHLVAGLEPSRRMPQAGDPLTDEQVSILRRWIDDGLPWTEGVQVTPSGLSARVTLPAIALPPATPLSDNPIDRLLAGYFAEHNISTDELIDDRVFARRVYLDLTGLLPDQAALEAFVADGDPAKREKLVDQLLANREAYAGHWLTFWNDMLRNAYHGPGFIDGGRRQVTEWLYGSLLTNKPYDQMVHELISPVPGSEGFMHGIIWRGTVNASQRREMQAAQNIGQVFLGTNLKCASCHDSFVNHWRLADSYALANVFADEPLELYRCDKPTGEMAETRFIYPGLGEIDPAAPKEERMRQLADILASPANGRVQSTMVNRMWAYFYGRGLVEPVDDLDQPAWSEDMLNFLAADFRDSGFDIQHTMRLICTSRAYQLPSVSAPGPDESPASFVFAGPCVKRMSAEQFLDAVAVVTLTPINPSALSQQGDGRSQGGQVSAAQRALAAHPMHDTAMIEAIAAAKWIWSDAAAATATAGGRALFRTEFTLPADVTQAALVASCDNQFILYVNGTKVAESNDWQRPVRVDLAEYLVEGRNVIAVDASNWPDEATGRGLEIQGASPAGLVLIATGEAGGESFAVASDGGWLVTAEAAEGWEQPEFDTAGWQHSAEVAGAAEAPWRLSQSLTALLVGPGEHAGTRASLLEANALLLAMGRSNREQVVTRRDSFATTLEALELTNGGQLDAALKQGGSAWLARDLGPAELVQEIYFAALGRAPSQREMEIALGLVGEAPTHESIQDLLWAITMLPEFQLIY